MEKTKVYKDFKESIPWTVLDQVLSSTPWINVAWWIMKSVTDNTRNMRVLRWIEFFEWITDPKFVEELGESEQALDWITICLEHATKERNKAKRKIIKNIFLWFSKLSEIEKEQFKLERLIDITSKITIDELDLLKEISVWDFIVKWAQKYYEYNYYLDFHKPKPDPEPEKMPNNPVSDDGRLSLSDIWQTTIKKTKNDTWIFHIDLIYWLISLWLITKIPIDKKEDWFRIQIQQNFLWSNSKKWCEICLLSYLWQEFIKYITD